MYTITFFRYEIILQSFFFSFLFSLVEYFKIKHLIPIIEYNDVAGVLNCVHPVLNTISKTISFYMERRNSISNDRRAHDYVCILMPYKSENEIHYRWHYRAVMAETKSSRGLSRTTKNFGLFNFSFRWFRNDSGGKFRFNA